MENYEQFIQRQVNQTKTNGTEEPGPAASQRSSAIRFYGLSILPPLLDNKQKEEIQRLREAAVCLANKRKSSRLSYIQTILDSVQLRQVLTLDNFKDETRDDTPSKTKPISYHSAFKNECDETIESHCETSYSPVFPCAQQMPGEKMPIVSGYPLTSTACDEHTAFNIRPLDGEDSLKNFHTTVLFQGVPLFEHKPDPAVELFTGIGFDAQLISQSHKLPQIDVSHQGLSSGYVTIETSDVSSAWVEGVDEIGKATEERCAELNSTSKAGDIISHTPVDGAVLEEEYTNATLSSQAQTVDIVEPVNPPVEKDPTEGPYRMSLQNLLKKSQEHRRRQRLLRNQAKALKDTEAGHDDHHSHSDKENDEYFLEGTGKTDPRKIREKKREQVKDEPPVVNMPSFESQTQTPRPDREHIEPFELTCYAEDPDVKSEVSLNHCFNITSASNNEVCISEKASPALPSHADLIACPLQSTSAAVSPSAKSLYQSKSKKTGSVLSGPCQAAGKKFKNVPAPKFCLSPVRSKKGSGITSSFRKPLLKTPVRVENKAGPNPCGQGRGAASLLAGHEEETPVCRSTDQGEQIAQLELNLSSLKVLISDLESTLSKSQADFDPTEADIVCNTSKQVPLTENESIGLPTSEEKSSSAITFSKTMQLEAFAIDNGTRSGSKQHEPPHGVTSLVQKMRVPEAFRTIGDSKCLSQRPLVLTDSSNQPEEKKIALGEKKKRSESIENSLNGSSLNRSYDVDTPSRLWSQAGSKEKQLTPEQGGQEGMSRAKRRLLMNTAELVATGQQGDGGLLQSSTPKGASQWPELQMRQEHEAQVRALMKEQHSKEQELLQSLATRYQFLRSVSFPCPSVGSRLEDVATSLLPPSSVSMGLGSSSQPFELSLAELSILSDSLPISQTPSSVPVCHRPLVAAAVKGYLTRRLCRTERVSQLIRTIKDTQQFLQNFHSQTPGREFGSRQDRVLQERVALQLRSARYELHDLFFSLGPADRMQVISWDRQLAREREFKSKENKEPRAGGKIILSAATKKALERRRTVMLQKKAAERTKLSLGEDSFVFVPNPRRVSKKATPLRRPR